MDTLWLAALSPDMPDETLYALLPPGRRARMSPSAPPHATSSVLTAYRLLAHGLGERFDLAAIPAMAVTPEGQPFFPGHPHIRFSLSHTRGCAVCALSDRPVGADAERIRPVGRKLFERLCGDVPYDEERFFGEWTAREAALKYAGRGSLLRPEPPPPGVSLRSVTEKGFLLCLCGEGALPGEPRWVQGTG